MLKAYDAYKKFIVTMNKILDAIIIVLMLGMVGVVFYQVIMRQIFENPPMWGEQISVLLLIWFVFFGIVLGLEENLHIGITMFVDKLPSKVIFVVEVFVNILIAVLAVLFVRFGYSHVTLLFSTGAVQPITGIPNGIFYIPVPLSGIMMGFVVAGKMAGQFVNRKGQPA